MIATLNSWDARVRRVEDLASASPATKEILTFYGELLRTQRDIEEWLRSRRDWLPSGCLSEDLSVLRDSLPMLLQKVATYGPAPLAQEARGLLTASIEVVDLERGFDHSQTLPKSPSHSHRASARC
jgi:hypothetical protein